MRFETDDEFRARLYYVTGSPLLARLHGRDLDHFAEEYNLRRRWG